MAFVPKTTQACQRGYGSLSNRFDVYRGRIVIKTGAWCEAFIAPGFVTIAHNLEPNNHEVVVPESALFGDVCLSEIDGEHPTNSRYVHLGAFLDDASDDASLCEHIRFGRIATAQRNGFIFYTDGPGAFSFDPLWDLVERDLDDTVDGFANIKPVDFRDFLFGRRAKS